MTARFKTIKAFDAFNAKKKKKTKRPIRFVTHALQTKDMVDARDLLRMVESTPPLQNDMPDVLLYSRSRENMASVLRRIATASTASTVALTAKKKKKKKEKQKEKQKEHRGGDDDASSWTVEKLSLPATCAAAHEKIRNEEVAFSSNQGALRIELAKQPSADSLFAIPALMRHLTRTLSIHNGARRVLLVSDLQLMPRRVQSAIHRVLESGTVSTWIVMTTTSLSEVDLAIRSRCCTLRCVAVESVTVASLMNVAARDPSDPSDARQQKQLVRGMLEKALSADTFSRVCPSKVPRVITQLGPRGFATALLPAAVDMADTPEQCHDAVRALADVEHMHALARRDGAIAATDEAYMDMFMMTALLRMREVLGTRTTNKTNKTEKRT